MQRYRYFGVSFVYNTEICIIPGKENLYISDADNDGMPLNDGMLRVFYMDRKFYAECRIANGHLLQDEIWMQRVIETVVDNIETKKSQLN